MSLPSIIHVFDRNLKNLYVSYTLDGESPLRSRSMGWFRQENIGNQRNMEAVFCPVPAGTHRKLAGIHRKKSEQFQAGILLPCSIDLRCFSAGSGGRNLQYGRGCIGESHIGEILVTQYSLSRFVFSL